MRKTTILLISYLLASTVHSAPAPATEQPLTIYSSEGRIEIKNPSLCSQTRTENGSLAINCTSQCKQSVDPIDGKKLIQC